MAENFALETMTLEELKELDRSIIKAIKTHETRRRANALAHLSKVASEYGFKLSDLTGEATQVSGRGVYPPKYRNPEDSSQTWSGRGRKPQWFVKAQEDGADVSDFLIAQR